MHGRSSHRTGCFATPLSMRPTVAPLRRSISAESSIVPNVDRRPLPLLMQPI